MTRAQFKKFIDTLRNYDIEGIDRVCQELNTIFECGTLRDINLIGDALLNVKELIR